MPIRDPSPDFLSALEEVAVEIHGMIIEAIESSKWPYERDGDAVITKRKSGETVGSPRDIVDLGGLRASQGWEVVDRGDGSTSARFYNRAPYASLVHEGGFNGRGSIPGRPFMSSILSGMDISEMVAARLRVQLSVNAKGQFTAKGEGGRFVSPTSYQDAGYDIDLNNFEGNDVDT